MFESQGGSFSGPGGDIGVTGLCDCESWHTRVGDTRVTDACMHSCVHPYTSLLADGDFVVWSLDTAYARRPIEVPCPPLVRSMHCTRVCARAYVTSRSEIGTLLFSLR